MTEATIHVRFPISFVFVLLDFELSCLLWANLKLECVLVLDGFLFCYLMYYTMFSRK